MSADVADCQGWELQLPLGEQDLGGRVRAGLDLSQAEMLEHRRDVIAEPSALAAPKGAPWVQN